MRDPTTGSRSRAKPIRKQPPAHTHVTVFRDYNEIEQARSGNPPTPIRVRKPPPRLPSPDTMERIRVGREANVRRGAAPNRGGPGAAQFRRGVGLTDTTPQGV